MISDTKSLSIYSMTEFFMPNLRRTFRNIFRFLSKSANSEGKSVVLNFEVSILMTKYGEKL